MKKLNLQGILLLTSWLLTLGLGSPITSKAQNFNLRYNHLEQTQKLSFTENKGQLKDENGQKLNEIRYYAHSKGMNIYLQSNKLQFVFEKNLNNGKSTQGIKEKLLRKKPLKHGEVDASRMELELLGANEYPLMEVQRPVSASLNFYLNGSQQGLSDVKSFEKIIYKNVYHNIDFEVEAQNGKLEYSFILLPGARVEDIRIKWNGVNETEISKDQVKYKCALGEITEANPYSFTSTGHVVASSFVRKDNISSFQTAAYNKDEVLVIDPTLAWATFFGGENNDLSYGTTVDKKGNVYITGATTSTTAIATSGAFQTSLAGSLFNDDIYLSKFNVNGKLVWGTYFGSDSADYGYGITVANNSIYIAGITSSTSGIATSGSYQSVYSAGTDGVLARFSASGKLIWATYYGGGGDDFVQNMTSDNSGGIYIAGYTNSSGLVANTAYQSKLGSAQDAFLAKFDSTSKLSWATYFGGDSDDYAIEIKADASANVYITGFTLSTKGIATSGAFQTSIKGGGEGYLAKFSSAGKLSWATYFGGDGDDYSTGIAPTGSNVYICGATNSSNGLATSGAMQKSFGGTFDGFVAQFTSSGSESWATYFGKSGEDAFNLAAPDLSGNVYVAGYTTSSAMATSGVFQTSFAGVYDALVTKFSSSGSLMWSTYLGGNDEDYAYGLHSDDSNRLFVSGYTASTSGLATSGSYQSSNGGYYDGFLAEIDDCNLSVAVTGVNTICKNGSSTYHATKNANCTYKWNIIGGTITGATNVDSVTVKWTTVGAAKVTVTEVNLACNYIASQSVTVNDAPIATFIATDPCLGDTVKFMNNSTQAVSYFWQFGDGDTSYSLNTKHKYKVAGSFNVVLAIKSPAGCVDTMKTKLNITQKPASHWTVKMNGLSGSFLAQDTTQVSYNWNFGDGSSPGAAFKMKHTYAAKGTYKIRLTVASAAGCSSYFDSSLIVSSTSVATANEEMYKLEMFPNPFDNTINIEYNLPEASKVKMELMDITGRAIKVADEEALTTGIHSQNFNTAGLKAGTYLIRISINGQTITKQVMKL